MTVSSQSVTTESRISINIQLVVHNYWIINVIKQKDVAEFNLSQQDLVQLSSLHFEGSQSSTRGETVLHITLATAFLSLGRCSEFP